MFNSRTANRSEREGAPKFVIGGSYTDRDWYKTLTKVPTTIVQLEEKTLVATRMRMMWVPKGLRAAPIYAFRGKGYSLMNVLDPEVGGQMMARILLEEEKPWVE
ncbi:hypothetical protein Hanom_Chr17g01587971 [Helianthus anomalus]